MKHTVYNEYTNEEEFTGTPDECQEFIANYGGGWTVLKTKPANESVPANVETEQPLKEQTGELFSSSEWIAKNGEIFMKVSPINSFDNGEIKIATCYVTIEGNAFKYKHLNPDAAKAFEVNPLLFERVITNEQAEANSRLFVEAKNMYFAIKELLRRGELIENGSDNFRFRHSSQAKEAKAILSRINNK